VRIHDVSLLSWRCEVILCWAITVPVLYAQAWICNRKPKLPCCANPHECQGRLWTLLIDGYSRRGDLEQNLIRWETVSLWSVGWIGHGWNLVTTAYVSRSQDEKENFPYLSVLFCFVLLLEKGRGCSSSPAPNGKVYTYHYVSCELKQMSLTLAGPTTNKCPVNASAHY